MKLGLYHIYEPWHRSTGKNKQHWKLQSAYIFSFVIMHHLKRTFPNSKKKVKKNEQYINMKLISKTKQDSKWKDLVTSLKWSMTQNDYRKFPSIKRLLSKFYIQILTLIITLNILTLKIYCATQTLMYLTCILLQTSLHKKI